MGFRWQAFTQMAGSEVGVWLGSLLSERQRVSSYQPGLKNLARSAGGHWHVLVCQTPNTTYLIDLLQLLEWFCSINKTLLANYHSRLNLWSKFPPLNLSGSTIVTIKCSRKNCALNGFRFGAILERIQLLGWIFSWTWIRKLKTLNHSRVCVHSNLNAWLFS